MPSLFIPDFVHKHHKSYFQIKEEIPNIREAINTFKPTHPEVSIVIPAYNEKLNILQTLSSLANTISDYKIEIIVVNNNSTDETQLLLDQVGVINVFQGIQGIKHARNAGLARANGKYILNADADTIYSPYWANSMIREIVNEDICCIYGRHSFIPSPGTNRIIYFFYEIFSDLMAKVRSKNEEAVNVYGFNSGFRKQQGIEVGGFEHPIGTNEDGWLALKLKKYGKLKLVSNKHARAWTSDRRLMLDGGILKAIFARIKKIVTGKVVRN